MTKTIEIIVSPTGQTKIETKGFSGSACRDASRFLEEALGIKTEDLPTAELYSEPAEERQVAREGCLTRASLVEFFTPHPRRAQWPTDQDRLQSAAGKERPAGTRASWPGRWTTRPKRSFHTVERGPTPHPIGTEDRPIGSDLIKRSEESLLSLNSCRRIL